MKKEVLIAALVTLGSSVYAQEESKETDTEAVNVEKVMAKATKEKQTKVQLSSQTFVDGVHTTFAVTFENVDANDIENFWKKQLKDMCDDLETKKQLTAVGARISTVHKDTIRVLAKAVQPRKSASSTMHLAFIVNHTDVGTGSGEGEEQRMKASEEFVYQRSLQFKRQLMEKELASANKALSRLQKTQAGLAKEKERAEKTMAKNLDKGTEAEKEKAKAEAELKSLAAQIKTKQDEVGADPSEANTEALNEMLGDREKATALRDKSEKLIITADKKVKDMQFALKKNVEDQANNKIAMEKATELVKTVSQRLKDLS